MLISKYQNIDCCTLPKVFLFLSIRMLRIAKQKGQMCKPICVELESDQMVKRHFIREHKEQNMPQEPNKIKRNILKVIKLGYKKMNF